MNKEKQKLYLKVFWGLFILPFIVVITIFFLISSGRMGFMPTFEDLENPENNVASQVYSSDGELLGHYFLQRRVYVDFDELSPNIVNALLATEDIRFRRHSGIDARGMGRVFVKSILLGQSAGGGSTITQQLAKNLFPRDTTNYNLAISRIANLGVNKFKEWITAAKLERNYTKDELLVMYLNTVYFGSHSYGIKSAANTFFDTTPDSLKKEEAATLVGVLRAPSWYSPVRNPERAISRRNVVLAQMRNYDFISQAEFDSLSALPLELDYNVEDQTKGKATHFREHLRNVLMAREPQRENYVSHQRYVRDSIEWANNPVYGWCNKNFKPDGTPYNLYRDGLRIYTTVNSKMQEYAEEAVRQHLGEELQDEFWNDLGTNRRPPFSNNLSAEQVESIMESAMRRTDRYRSLRVEGVSHDSIVKIFNKPVEMSVFSWEGEIDTVMTPRDSIKYYKSFLRSGFMAMEPGSGQVKAYVGGPNMKHFPFDHVSLGARQTGSLIKPFLYTVAMEEGYEPCDRVANVPQSFVVNDSVWTPRNASPTDYDGEMVPLQWGLANSINNVSAWLIDQFTPYAVKDLLRKMGVRSNIDPVKSIFLGTSDMTLREVVAAFATYANEGVYNEPLMVTRIEDRHGNVLAEFQPRMQEAINEKSAYLMINLLRAVVDEGTGIRLRERYGFDAQMAGKTGTTQNMSDGWFVGMVPNLVGGVWTGGEDRSIHFDHISQGQGANMALPIWALFIEKVFENEELGVCKEDEFESPPGFDINLDCGDWSRPDRTRQYDTEILDRY